MRGGGGGAVWRQRRRRRLRLGLAGGRRRRRRRGVLNLRWPRGALICGGRAGGTGVLWIATVKAVKLARLNIVIGAVKAVKPSLLRDR